MDKSHAFMGRQVDGNIDDAQHNDFTLVGPGNGDCQFHQRDDMIGVVKRNQYPVGITVFAFRLLHLEHLGHIGCGNFFKVHEINKQADDDPGNGDVPCPGIEIELINRQKHVQGDGGNRSGRV